METKKEEKKREQGRTARLIALIVTCTIMAGTVIVVAISYFKGEDDKILQVILPLWGTWIGTVLAFYFGKTNFEVANQSYQETVKTLNANEKIAQLYVKNHMTTDITFLEYHDSKDEKIADILEDERFRNFNRFPIFENGIVKCIINRGLFYEFIQLKVKDGMETSLIKELTLNNLLQEEERSIQNKLERNFVVVSMDATLLDAKNAIDTIPECEVVFVTKTGRKDEPVCGLITNSQILKEATV